jgi:hypothetical protein
MASFERPTRDQASRVRPVPEPVLTPPEPAVPTPAFGFNLDSISIFPQGDHNTERATEQKTLRTTPVPSSALFGQPLDDPQLASPPASSSAPVSGAPLENVRSMPVPTPNAFATGLQRDALNEPSSASLDEPDPHAQLGAARGRGQPLPDRVRGLLESRWDTDLSGVRVHTDQTGDAVSQGFEARALTSGSDIFFRAGTYNPDSLEGARLIAHESWHAVQQGRGTVQGGVDADAGLESEAQRKGAEISSEDLTGAKASPAAPISSSAASRSPASAVQREPMTAPRREERDAPPPALEPSAPTPAPDGASTETAVSAETQLATEAQLASQAQPKAKEPALLDPASAPEEPAPLATPQSPDAPASFEAEATPVPEAHGSLETAADVDAPAPLEADSAEPEDAAQPEDALQAEDSSQADASEVDVALEGAEADDTDNAASDSEADPDLSPPPALETGAQAEPEPAPAAPRALTVQRQVDDTAAPQVTPEAAKTAGQQLIAAVRGAAQSQMQAVNATATEHATQIKARAQVTAQEIRQSSSQHKAALNAAVQSSRAQTATHAASSKASVQGAVTAQRGALGARTTQALNAAQQALTAKQSETTQAVNQELTTLNAQQQQTLQTTDQRFQDTGRTARQTGSKGGSSGVAPEVGQAKQQAGQQMGEDAAKDVNTAQTQTRTALQHKGAQATATFRQKGAQAAAQLAQTLPGTRAALQAKNAAGQQHLTQLNQQAATSFERGKTVVAQQLGKGSQQVGAHLEKTATTHAQRAQRSGDKIAVDIQNHASKTNARTKAALQQLEDKASQGVDPAAVARITAQVTGKLGAAQGKVQTGVQTLGTRAQTALQTGSSQAVQAITQTANDARQTAQQTTQDFRAQLDGMKTNLLPVAAQITTSSTQAQTQVNTAHSTQLSALTGEHKKNFSAGREKIAVALTKDGTDAATTAKTKVTGDLSAKVGEGQQRIESKAVQEKANLENQAQNKDGQTRAQQATTAPTQRAPVQRWAWLDSVFDWFGKQWDKIKSTFLSPSFWAGLIVGLVVAIAIVAAVAAIIATGGAAAGVLLALGPLLLPVVGGVAGAAAGFAGTVASNVTHNIARETGPDGQFHERGIFEGAGRNTLLGLGAGVALAYAPATLPWLIGGGAAVNVAIGAYDNVQNGKPWYESLGADAVIGGVSALIGFGAFKGYAGAARGTVVDPTNIPTNPRQRANVRERLNNGQSDPTPARDTPEQQTSQTDTPEPAPKQTDAPDNQTQPQQEVPDQQTSQGNNTEQTSKQTDLPEQSPATKSETPEPAPHQKTRQERLDELSFDQDRGGVDAQSKREAEVLLDLEERGMLPEPVRRPGTGERGDGIDGSGQSWDIKRPRSRSELIQDIQNEAVAKGKKPPQFPANKPIKGEFEVNATIEEYKAQIASGKKLIIETDKLTPSDLASLKSFASQEGIDGNIIWYP